MKKTKILLGALCLTGVAPMMPAALTSCGQGDNSFTPSITYDKEVITNVTTSKTELNRAFSVTCTCKTGYQVNIYTTKVTVGNKQLTRDEDYIIYQDVIIVGSAAVTEKNVTIDIKTDVADKYTVALYANDGQFADASKYVFLSDVAKGTKLKDIDGYVKPTHTSQEFTYWLDSEGNKVSEETQITKNLMLGAYYKEEAKDPVALKDDNWATVAAQCASMSKFVKAYLDKTFTGTEDEAKEIILAEIKKNAEATAVYPQVEENKTLYKTVTLTLGQDWTTDVKVRLIDVGVDVAADGSTKPLFTWEFANALDVGCYSQKGNSHWAEFDESGELVDSCLLRENCNKALMLKLPASLTSAMVPVKKSTPYYDAGVKPNITTTDLMWPLTLSENGLSYGSKNFSKQGDTYAFYGYMDGKETRTGNSKQYLGYDGTKEYTEGYKPTLNYPLWTRRYYDTMRMYMWNPDNQSVTIVYTNNGWAVAPCFCL